MEQHVLIIGAGGIGKRHLRGFLKTERCKVSVCEPVDAVREDVCTHCPIGEAHASLNTVDLSALTAAVVAAPAHVHIPLASTLAEAGVPFLLEKPLAVTLDGVDALLRLVEEKQLLARVGYILRLRPWLTKAREDLRAGKIGRVLMARFVNGQDYRKYRPDYQTTYYAKERMGGGAILDAASHFLDYALWTLGPVTQISALRDCLTFEGVECEDCVLMNLRFTSGVLGSLTLNQFQKPNESSITFIGTDGNMTIDMITGTITIASDDSGVVSTENLRPDDGLSALEFHESMFAVQANAFLDALGGAPDSLATLDDAAQNLRIALAAKKDSMPTISD